MPQAAAVNENPPHRISWTNSLYIGFPNSAELRRNLALPPLSSVSWRIASAASEIPSFAHDHGDHYLLVQ